MISSFKDYKKLLYCSGCGKNLIETTEVVRFCRICGKPKKRLLKKCKSLCGVFGWMTDSWSHDHCTWDLKHDCQTKKKTTTQDQTKIKV